MRVVKMYAWEQTIGSKLAEVRAQELRLVRKQRFMSAFLSVFMTTQPLFLTVSTFSVYAASGRPLEANIVLPALALLSLLRMPIAFLPMILMQLANLKVAIGRITKFLMNEELSEEIKARCLETEARGEARGVAPPAAIATAIGEILSETPNTGVAMMLQTASNAAEAAVDLVSSAFAAEEVDGASPGLVRPKAAKQGWDAARVAVAALNDDITIEGTFRWQKVEVEAGKGKGKGGRGGRGSGGGGRGGGAAPSPAKRSLSRKFGSRKLSGRWSFHPGRSSSPVPVRAAAEVDGLPVTTKPVATSGTTSAENSSSASPTTSSTADTAAAEAAAAAAEAAPPSPSSKGGRGRGGGAAAAPSETEGEKKAVPPTLHRLSISFPHGQLTMVAGAVGCGKSSLLCALLGELRSVADDDADADDGRAASSVRRSPGAVGYFAQTPFILNETLRGNILLGAPIDEAWYQTVLAACALLPDLKVLPGGDMTQIGEKGINLSGGQKARIALARACYARTRTLILDDPLSAVDAHVGRHIFREVLGPAGLLAGTTRILVTHQTQYLPLADKVVLLEQGAVLAQGSFTELQASEVDLSAISTLGDGSSYTPEDLAALLGTHDEATDGPKPVAEAPLSPLKPFRSANVKMGDKTKDNAGATLVMDEERATGSVSWATHMTYVRAMGGGLSLGLLFLAVAADKFFAVATDYWLALWIDPSTSKLGEVTPAQNVFEFWIPIYVGGVLVTGVLVYFRAVFFNVSMGLRAARVIYSRLCKSVLAAPMLFFETTPSGRILNRFTSDTEQVDFALLMTLSQWTNCISNVIGALVLICTVNPWFLCVLPFFGAIYSAAYWLSCSATRDLQRLEAVTRSPIFTQFSETLSGLSTIRAFGRTTQFERASLELVAANTRCFFNQDAAAQWISQRLDFCSACIAGITVLLPTLVLQFGSSLSSSPAAFGLCITYALDLSAFLKFGTKMTLDIQRGMAGVERILEYADNTPSEPTGGMPAPVKSWPTAGRIVTHDLCVRYRPELPLALRGVSCTIEPRAKVGIVGRTGSGKTTFVSALWRLVEPTRGESSSWAQNGAIEIDGVDLSLLELYALRSRLAIIVQDPVLFNASVRYNLDPFGEHSDADVKNVVTLAQLDVAVSALPEGLESPVGEAGANFSVGQRQLICLARAMLRRSKLVVLDEATASIDNETDAILQSTIREVFADATVLTIAHRLHTIMDSTQVMVFDQGELKEFDPPPVLLADEESLFSKLVADTGSAATHLRALAAEAAAAAPQ